MDSCLCDLEWRTLRLELMELGSEPSGSSFLRQIQIQSELEYLVQSQLEDLKRKEGPLDEKFLIDGRSYAAIWWDTERDLGLFFIGSDTLLFFLSAVSVQWTNGEKCFRYCGQQGMVAENWIRVGLSAPFCIRCLCSLLWRCRCFHATTRLTVFLLQNSIYTTLNESYLPATG